MFISMHTNNINKNKLKFATSGTKRMYFREKTAPRFSIGKFKIIQSSV